MTTRIKSIFDYTPEPEEGKPETTPLDGHWDKDGSREKWVPRDKSIASNFDILLMKIKISSKFAQIDNIRNQRNG
jgi:hypothetical protein